MKLAGKTFGVIDFEGIRQGTAKIARALGTKVLAYDGYPSRVLETGNCRYASLDELLAQADIISFHCPLFSSTKEIINKDSIAKVRDRVKVISTSRGPLIMERGSREAPDSEEVSGTAVDVISTEPVREDNPLLGTRSMTITPHIAWAPKESRQRLINIAVDNLRRFVDGVPQNAVNKQQENQVVYNAGP